jgi:Predicted membrane protein/domain
MDRPVFKRICAYIIDIAIVSFILFLFSKIEILNPNVDKINSIQNEYEKYIETVAKNDADVTKLLKDDKVQNYIYELAKLQVPTSILNVVITFGYFVVFQFFNKGQTIGKKFMKIRVKSIKGDKLSFMQVFGRSLLINEILVSILIIIFVSCLSQSVYFNARRILELIDMIIVYGSLGFMMFRSDGCGIHDLLVHTCVVNEDEAVNREVEEVKEEIKTTKVREAKVTNKSTKKNVKKM